MKILCYGYRDWAIEIYKRISLLEDVTVLITGANNNADFSILDSFNPDLILFYGWSKIIPASIIDSQTCLMLHPSKLPKYRGGSPLQNQIIRGEKNSAVTIFKMTNELDAGPIARQEYLSLEGYIPIILTRMTEIGYLLTKDIIVNGLSLKNQNHDSATSFKRRTPKESELTLEELKTKSAEYLNNKIRMLSGPYPTAYITTADGKKLLILKSEISQ